jgi:hypothetical protein
MRLRRLLFSTRAQPLYSFFPGAEPIAEQALLLSSALREVAPDFEAPTLVTSSDITTCPSPNICESLATQLSTPNSRSSKSHVMQIGGLAGLPFTGREGWSLYRDAAAKTEQTDLLVVYGCHAAVNASTGLISEKVRSSIMNAWEVVDAVEGIDGISDDLLSDRFNAQQAYLYLRLAAQYDTIAAHPEPLIKLVYSNFGMVQDYLREVIDWSEVSNVRLAALGGITLTVVEDGTIPVQSALQSAASKLFMPVSFELLDTEEGALYDLMDDIVPNDENRPPYRKLLFPLPQTEP